MLDRLVAAKQADQVAFHYSLFAGTGRVFAARPDSASSTAGLDPGRFARDREDADVKAEIGKDPERGRTLQLIDTLAYIFEDQLLLGELSYDTLEAAVVKAQRWCSDSLDQAATAKRPRSVSA